MIPISVVKLDTRAEELVLSAIRSGQIVQGEFVEQLEHEFSEMIGVTHAVAVNNGTTSLIAALEAMGVGPGDEVITSPFTFVATLNAILACGATARFADISTEDFNITAENIAAQITPRTRALIPVHLYGQGADMTAITALAAEKNLLLLEDAAQAHGAAVDGTPVGTFGVGSFSFYATKNITTAEGGMITTNDDSLADRLRVLRNQGMRARYQYELAGNNWRMTNIHAAIGLSQLSGYNQQVKQRRANATFYGEALSDIPGIELPKQLPGREHVWHQYTLRVTSEARVTRDELVDQLTGAGIGCGIYYPKLVYDYPPYYNRADVVPTSVPNAEMAVREVVSIPIHPQLSASDLDEVAGAIRTIMAGR